MVSPNEEEELKKLKNESLETSEPNPLDGCNQISAAAVINTIALAEG